ncbi:MAG: SIMPL domain-containing protein [Stellaceae bacterium]
MSRCARIIAGGLWLSLSLPTAAMAAAAPLSTVLHLSDTAEHVVKRDQLTIEMRTEATGTDPRLVQAEVNRRMAAALGKAKSTPAVTAASGSYYTYSFTGAEKDGKPVPPEQWRAVQNLSLTSGNFAAALVLAGQLQAGGLVVTAMRFGVSSKTLHMEEQSLTHRALAQIEARAGRVAAALGLKVGSIESLTVGNAESEGRSPMPMMARMGGTKSSMPAPVVAVGESTVSVTVRADVLLSVGP